MKLYKSLAMLLFFLSITSTVDMAASLGESHLGSVASRHRLLNKPQTLHEAVESGDTAIVEAFLRNKAVDINIINSMDDTALCVAVQRGYIDIARLLIERGADVDTKGEHGLTPLYHAATDGHVAMVKALVEAGTDINAKGESGWTVLHSVAMEGEVKIAKVIVELGGNIDAKDDYGWTPLHNAVLESEVEMARALVEGGADMELESHKNGTPLALAIKNRCSWGYLLLEIEKIIILLVKRGALLPYNTVKDAVFLNRLHKIRMKRLRSIGRYYDDLLGDDFPNDLKGLLLEFHGASRREKMMLGYMARAKKKLRLSSNK